MHGLSITSLSPKFGTCASFNLPLLCELLSTTHTLSCQSKLTLLILTQHTQFHWSGVYSLPPNQERCYISNTSGILGKALAFTTFTTLTLGKPGLEIRDHHSVIYTANHTRTRSMMSKSVANSI